MSPSPARSGLLPMPGTPSSSWAVYKARFRNALSDVFRDPKVLVAFWLFGLINNVLYVIILSAAQDLVGSDVPKGAVLLADVLPSFFTKLIAPYFIHKIPYWLRILVLVVSSSLGMVMVALTPPDRSIASKMLGIVFASFSSGAGELSFLGLTHYYGHMSLAAWGSGTGAAGIAGAFLYIALTDWLGLGVKNSILASAFLPVIMLISYFVILPRGPLRDGDKDRHYDRLPDRDSELDHNEEDEDMAPGNATSSLLAPTVDRSSRGPSPKRRSGRTNDFDANLRQVKTLFFPYMLPLFLVYLAEYAINQGVATTLLFPLESSPFSHFRQFYPRYALLYQIGVFVSRTSIAFFRIPHLYTPSFLQVANFVLLTLQAMFNFIPSVYIVFIIIFWEGLLGGTVYVNTFAGIMEQVPEEDREFSLSATSVSDSAGICLAGVVGAAMEVWLCSWQVDHGRDWCKKIDIG